MSVMNGPILFQNTLLVIIASLLLVIVIQNSQSHGSSYEMPAAASYSDHASGGMGGGQPAQPMKTSMVFQALKGFPAGCDVKQILAECNSPAAELVKDEILKMESSGQGIRQIFDAVVAKYGEKVLTDQALQIRKMRVKGSK